MSDGVDSSASSSSGDYMQFHTQEKYSSSIASGCVHGNPFLHLSCEWGQLKQGSSLKSATISGFGNIQHYEHYEHLLNNKMTTVLTDLKDEYHYELTLTESEKYAHKSLVKPKKNDDDGDYTEFLLGMAKRVCQYGRRLVMFEEVVQTLIDCGVVGFGGIRPAKLAIAVIECAVDAGIFSKAHNFDDVSCSDAMWITHSN